MARKKTITHDQILNAAYDLVVEQGFKSFTARNIAKKMNCSTQPIYLEFKNMAELKQAVMDRIKELLSLKMAKHFTNVFVEDHFGVDEMREYAMSTAMRVFDSYEPAQHLNEAQLRNTICGVWIVATGIANLMAPGFIDITRDQMVDILTAVTQDFIVNGRFSDDPRISWFQDAKIAQGY